jgi:hypothetical protein
MEYLSAPHNRSALVTRILRLHAALLAFTGKLQPANDKIHSDLRADLLHIRAAIRSRLIAPSMARRQSTLQSTIRRCSEGHRRFGHPSKVCAR